MTDVHYIALAVGAAVGVFVTWLLIRMVRGSVDHINQPFETNGEADLAPSAKESFADVKDTF